MIRIVILVGSVRPANFSRRAADLIADQLNTRDNVHVTLIDPTHLHLPLPGAGEPGTDVATMRQQVSQATGVIIVNPEYHGGISSVTKLIIDNLGFPSDLSGKPIALCGVAAGRIGAIKSLEQLRSVCSHVGGLVLPGPVSMAAVHTLFDDNGTCTDSAAEARIRGVATNLLDYIDGHICPRIALEAMVREQSTTSD